MRDRGIAKLMRRTQEGKKSLEIDGLRKMVVEISRRGASQEHVGCVTRDRDDEYAFQLIVGSELAGDLISIQTWQPDIEQQDVRPATLGGGHGIAAVIDSFDLETDEFQELGQRNRQVVIVISNEDETPLEDIHQQAQGAVCQHITCYQS
jgi:hypothetical protein